MSFAYFPDGQLQTVTDADQHTTNYTYDAMGRMAGRSDPLQRTESFTYDLNGNPYQWADRKAQVTTHEYDGLSRLHRITYADASRLTYVYDSRDRLTEIADSLSASPITRTYDDFDRVTSENGPQGSTSYTYDDANNRETMTINGQSPVNYSYDAADRLTSLSHDMLAVEITYDDAGRRTLLSGPHGIATQYVYDDANQLTSLTYQNSLTVVGDLHYTYDSSGRRTQVSGSLARTELPQVVPAATYDAANELMTWGGHTLSYDLDGNLTSDGLSSYEWDARSELVSILGQTAATYAYDALLRREQKTTAAGTTMIGHDGLSENTESTMVDTLTPLRAGDMDEYFSITDTAGDFIPLADGLGTVIAILDSSGAIYTSYSYEPFGRAVAAGSSSAASSWQFTGRENDGNGLYYYRARYYSPVWHRFISEDPVSPTVDGFNLYAYVGDNPISYRDPLGLSKLTPAQCAELLAKILVKTAKLEAELAKYDPIKDAIGGFPMKWGSGKTKPGGHYEEITNLQRGLRNDLNDFERGCNNRPDDPKLPKCEELSKRLVPRPAPPAPDPGPETILMGAAWALSQVVLRWLPAIIF